MKPPVFVSGNLDKVRSLQGWLGRPIDHLKIELDELQSLSIEKVVAHKARQAYSIHKNPILIEDTALQFTALGRLPGTFIKFFLQDISLEAMCRMLDGFEDRGAIATVCYGLFEGSDMHFFKGEVRGSVPLHPIGEHGYGWDSIFKPDGAGITYAQMSESYGQGDLLTKYSVRKRAVVKLKNFLDKELA